MHHLCIEVENLEQTLKELKTKGIRLIDEKPTDTARAKDGFYSSEKCYRRFGGTISGD